MTDLTEGERREAREVVALVAEGRAAESAALDQRDEMIRRHRANGVPYLVLEDAFGLSRWQLDAIRRGKRRPNDR